MGRALRGHTGGVDGAEYDGYTGGAVDERSKVRVKTIASMGVHHAVVMSTVSHADAICNPYLPPDTQYKGSTSVKGSTGLVMGTEKRYASVRLANTLPASDFTDVKGQTVGPGTLYIYDAAQYSGSPVMVECSCVLSTGENFAQNL